MRLNFSSPATRIQVEQVEKTSYLATQKLELKNYFILIHWKVPRIQLAPIEPSVTLLVKLIGAVQLVHVVRLISRLERVVSIRRPSDDCVTLLLATTGSV